MSTPYRYAVYLIPPYTISRQVAEVHQLLEKQFGLKAAGRFQVHATIKGFFKKTPGPLEPLVARLDDRYRVVGVDLRGHGASETVTDEARLGNDAMARDVLRVLDHLGIDRFALLGVSLGGGVAVLVASEAPQRVVSLMLCEAIALDPGEREKQGVPFEDAESPLVAGARRRRRVWDDRAGVEASYGSRPPLDALDPEVLSAYVRWGFVDRSDGRIELACDPETEASIFSTTRPNGPTHSFERLAEAITVLKGLFAEGPFDFAGDHYTISGLDGQPECIQKPHPPFIIAGGGRRVLSLAAREADIVGLNANMYAGVIDQRAGPSATPAAGSSVVVRSTYLPS
jgi:pimeloyl-ACP methyl ester carboxylesterase